MTLLEKALSAYQEHYASLSALAVSITGNVQDAEDVMQAVLLRFLEYPERITSARNLRSLLQIAVRNQAIDLLRKRGRSIPTEQEGLAQCVSPCATCELEEMLSALALRKHLAELPAPLREAFLQHVLYGARIKDIARELGIAPNTVTQQFRRIKARLRAVLAEEASHF